MRWILPFVVACGSPPGPAAPKPSAELEVPFRAAPTVDGTIDAREWAGAAIVTIEDVTLRFMHDRVNVYIAVERPTPTGFVCVLVAEPSTVHVLHASAKLGSATYVAAPDGSYDPRSKDYVWRDGEEMSREEGWSGTTMTSPPAQELAITFARIRGRPIAISFFHSPPDAQDLASAKTIVWPAGLDDAAANVQLVAGFNPDGLQFDPARWVVLVPR